MSTPIPVGNEFLISTTTYHSSSTITALSDGCFVVAWSDGTNGKYDVRVRLFNADGSTTSEEFLINSSSTGCQHSPTITPVSDGFAVAWQDWDGTTGNEDVRVRLFNADGSTASDEFLVNSTITGYQHSPTITALRNGRFVVAWSDASNGNDDVRARLFNADGSTASDEFLVNSTITSYQHSPTITALRNGRFVVAWSEASNGNDDVRVRLFNADGSTASDEFLVNSTITSYQHSPTITALRNGRFVVAWSDASKGNDDVRARLFNTDGSTASDEFLVNSTITGHQHSPTSTTLSDGRFVVAWST